LVVCSKRVVFEERATWKVTEWIKIKENEVRNRSTIEREVVWVGVAPKKFKRKWVISTQDLSSKIKLNCQTLTKNKGRTNFDINKTKGVIKQQAENDWQSNPTERKDQIEILFLEKTT